MITNGALVSFKNKAALVKRDGDRLELSMRGKESARVRDKDVELIHPGPLAAFPQAETGGDFDTAWEMTRGGSVPLADFAELVFGRDGPAERLACWERAQEGLPFRWADGAVYALDADEREKEAGKRAKKENEATERSEFLARAKLKNFQAGDERWLGEVEALALGKTQKSKNAADLGAGDSPESAHAWLLKVGLWDASTNPHPSRSGHPAKAPELDLGADDDEGREDLCAMEAWAIDNAWSKDPDDAISWDGQAVWVHVADPASAIAPDSPADREAADRSGTLYLPEGTIPMLPDEALRRFGLGLSERSRALSFRIELDEAGLVGDVRITPSWVRVKRLSYEQADALLAEGALARLSAVAQLRAAYRAKNGAVDIAIPEVRVWLDGAKPRVDAIDHYRSSDVVREMMVMAGEGAARWAFKRALPFPYYSQEAPGSQEGLPPGLAGEFAKRRLMRAGMAGAQPRAHQGLGVTMYAQITSPLRRYADLLGHQQLRAALAQERGAAGQAPLPADELSMRLARAAAGAQALRKAERSSEAHWTLAYLLDHADWLGEGIVVQPGNEALVYLPGLGLETRVRESGLELNQSLPMRFLKADITRLDAAFAPDGQ